MVSGAARGQALLGPMWSGLTPDSKGGPTGDTEEPYTSTLRSALRLLAQGGSDTHTERDYASFMPKKAKKSAPAAG